MVYNRSSGGGGVENCVLCRGLTLYISFVTLEYKGLTKTRVSREITKAINTFSFILHTYY